jgi:hypothetical protein
MHVVSFSEFWFDVNIFWGAKWSLGLFVASNHSKIHFSVTDDDSIGPVSKLISE